MKKAIFFLALGALFLAAGATQKTGEAQLGGMAVGAVLVIIGIRHLMKARKQKKPAAEKQREVQTVQPVVAPPAQAREEPDAEGRTLRYMYDDVRLRPDPDYSWADMSGDEVTYRMRGDTAEAWAGDERIGTVRNETLSGMISDYLRRGDRIVSQISDVDEESHTLTVDLAFWR